MKPSPTRSSEFAWYHIILLILSAGYYGARAAVLFVPMMVRGIWVAITYKD